MLWDQKTLFDHTFFEKTLGQVSKKDFVIRYFLTDSRNLAEPALSCFVGIKGETFDGSDYAAQAYGQGIRVFVLSKAPNLPEDAIVFLVPDTLKALGALAAAHKKRLLIPHILITGSVGKTTTRLLCAAVLKQKYPVHTAKKNFNNEIGLPLSILETPAEAKASVLEAGMSSKGEIARLSRIVNPEIAIITNVHLIHAGPLGGIDGVAEAKGEITEGMGPNSLLLLNEKDPFKGKLTSKAKGGVQFFDPSALKITKNLGVKGFFFSHTLYEDISFFCPLAGEHLLLNLAAVFAVAELFNVPPYLIKKGIEEIPPLPERMNFLQKGKTLVIADFYNASLPSFKAALDVLKNSPKPRTAVVGDILELGDFAESLHRQLMQYIIDEGCADSLWVHGFESIKAAASFKEKIPVREFPVFQTLRETLPELYPLGGSVLIKASHGMGFSALLPSDNKG